MKTLRTLVVAAAVTAGVVTTAWAEPSGNPLSDNGPTTGFTTSEPSRGAEPTTRPHSSRDDEFQSPGD